MIAQNGSLLGRYWRWAYPGGALYSPEEVDLMVANEGYIPVANAAELDALRNTTTQRMGNGTKWRGQYTTGINKKYIQVGIFEANSFSGYISFEGTFRGNHLMISTDTPQIFEDPHDAAIFEGIRLTIDYQDLSGTLPKAALFKQFSGTANDCIAYGSMNVPNSEIGGFTYNTRSTATIINNCHSYVDIIAASAGGFINNQAGGEITNCHTEQSISGVRSNSGGFISKSISTSNVNISKCYSESNIEYNPTIVAGGKGFGGFAGNMNGGTIIKIDECYATGNVNGINTENYNDYAGGFVGSNAYTITNSYATGNVNGYRIAGGFAGFNSTNGNISTCYSTGEVTGMMNFGGLCGLNYGSISNSYWNITTSLNATSSGGTGLTDAEMQVQANFTGLDFATIWEMVVYPRLKWELT